MTSNTTTKPRPLSPHLGIYKPQISSAMSIFHRITGVVLSLVFPLFLAWLLSVVNGPSYYTHFMQLCHTVIGQIVLMGLSWAFFYHFCCGIRHLLWDAGLFINIKGLYRTGWIALCLSTLMTLVLWLAA